MILINAVWDKGIDDKYKLDCIPVDTITFVVLCLWQEYGWLLHKHASEAH